MTVAALYVLKGGPYFGLEGVEPWDEERDARLYSGPWPVVAHPPCARWCRLAGLVESRWGHKKGDDGGCFESALSAVRKYGGVLEHPAYSDAWSAFGLNKPPGGGGWVNADFVGGWTCHVEQGNYGHKARKATRLYAFGSELPSLLWGKSDSSAWVSWCNNHSNGKEIKRIGKDEAAKTPAAFMDILLSMARSVVDARDSIL